MILNLFYNDVAFQPWAKHLNVINSLLCTINSSCNFAIYCWDVVFRQCVSAISIDKLANLCKKKPNNPNDLIGKNGFENVAQIVEKKGSHKVSNKSFVFLQKLDIS